MDRTGIRKLVYLTVSGLNSRAEALTLQLINHCCSNGVAMGWQWRSWACRGYPAALLQCIGLQVEEVAGEWLKRRATATF